MRGEQSSWLPISRMTFGSPPRARGAGLLRHPGTHLRGITPACAGSRAGTRTRCRPGRDHPRVRGEQASGGACPVPPPGSPPRARGADFLTWGAKDQQCSFCSLCFGLVSMNTTRHQPTSAAISKHASALSTSVHSARLTKPQMAHTPDATGLRATESAGLAMLCRSWRQFEGAGCQGIADLTGQCGPDLCGVVQSGAERGEPAEGVPVRLLLF